MYTFDLYDDNAVEWIGDFFNFDATTESNTYPAVCVIGDRFYKGKFLPASEIEKAYKTMDGAFHDINHWGTSYPNGFGTQTNIEYVIGFQKNTKYDPVTKRMTTEIYIEDTAPKAEVWKGFMNICRKANKVPNVSVAFWASSVEKPVSELPKDVDYKQYGLGDNDNVIFLTDLEFHALSTVFKGACDDKTGCGIGITYDNDNTITISIDSESDIKPYYYAQADEIEKLKKEILKEKIKKEELINGGKIY